MKEGLRIQALNLKRLRELSEAQINVAGPRYTPGIDPDAPNLTIDSLHLAQSCSAHSPECFDKLTELAENLEEAISGMPPFWRTRS